MAYLELSQELYTSQPPMATFENYAFLNEFTKGRFYLFCNLCCVNQQLHSEAWSYWQNVVERWPFIMQKEEIPYHMCCALYRFLVDRNFQNFLARLRDFEMLVDLFRTLPSLDLTRKYSISLTMSIYHNQLCQTVFNSNNACYEEMSKVPWLLFLVAKCLQIATITTLMDAYNLYLCCFSFAITLTDSHRLKQPFDLMSTVATEPVACIFEYLCFKLDLPLTKFTVLYKEVWIPFQMFLQQICHYLKSDLVEYLESKYADSFSRLNDFDEMLFLKNDEVLCVSYDTCVVPNINIGFDAVTFPELADSPIYQISRNMKRYLASARYSEKRFSARVSTFTAWFFEVVEPRINLMNTQTTLLCSGSVKLFLLKLESILKMEEKKISQIDYSQLLCNMSFSKSLFALCVAVVLLSEGLLLGQFTLKWISETLNIPAHHLLLTIEAFLLHEPFLPEEVTAMLMKYQIHLLTEAIWKEPHSMQFMNLPSVRKSYDLTGDLLRNAFKDQDSSTSVKYVMNVVRRLMQSRLLLFCENMDLEDNQFIDTWPCLEHAIFHQNGLAKDRHLDQLMLCSVYAIAKVTDKEIQFRRIIDCYKKLHLGPAEIYKNVLIADNNYGTIITFYNAVFMPRLKDFVLHLGIHIKNGSRNASFHTSFQELRSVYHKQTCWF